MMWRTHAGTGTLLGLTANGVWIAAAHLGFIPQPTPTSLVALPFVTAYLTVIPDVDHHAAKIRYAFPPARALFVVCRFLCRLIFGEAVAKRWFRHRGITHGYPCAITLGLVVGGITALGTPAPFRVLTAASFIWVVWPWIFRRRRGRRGRAALVLTAAAFLATTPWPGWLALAITLGCVAHVEGDCLTNSGCARWAPFSWRRSGLRGFDTNSKTERGFAFVQSVACVTLTVALIFTYLSGHATPVERTETPGRVQGTTPR